MRRRAAIDPLRTASANALAPAAWTPTSRTRARASSIARAVPASSPPPPTGTTIASRSGRSSSISRATVPWPAITAGSSKAWM